MRDVNLQRRHFQFLALTLFNLKGKLDPAAHAVVVDHMIANLRTTNSGFKTDRFYDWCMFGHTPRRPTYRATKARPLPASMEVEHDPFWE